MKTPLLQHVLLQLDRIPAAVSLGEEQRLEVVFAAICMRLESKIGDSAKVWAVGEAFTERTGLPQTVFAESLLSLLLSDLPFGIAGVEKMAAELLHFVNLFFAEEPEQHFTDALAGSAPVIEVGDPDETVRRRIAIPDTDYDYLSGVMGRKKPVPEVAWGEAIKSYEIDASELGNDVILVIAFVNTESGILIVSYFGMGETQFKGSRVTKRMDETIHLRSHTGIPYEVQLVKQSA